MRRISSNLVMCDGACERVCAYACVCLHERKGVIEAVCVSVWVRVGER